MNPEKKISFGFNRLSKKPTLLNKPEEKKLDYVLGLEGQSIKLKSETKEVEKKPLIIPLKDDQKDLLDRVRDMKAKQTSNLKVSIESLDDTRPDSELTIEELAAREVVREAKLRLTQSEAKNSKVFVLPIKKENELPLEGEKESTITDYENVPVNDFGLAMLRGMGWQEGMGIGKNPTNTALTKAPELRPKGLGLGASTLVNAEIQKQSACDVDGKALILKKGCYAKIIAGNNKGNYCEVQGLDDEAGRVVVKTSLKGDVLTLSEFMLIPVTKEEYSRNSKVLNSAKFEEYKEMEERKIKSEKNDNHSPRREDKYKREDTQIKKEQSPSRDSDKEKRHTSTKIKSEKTDRHSSEEDSSRRSSSRKDKKGSEKHSKKYDSSDSDSDNEKSRRIHKRKDKRRHRDKSRSPYKTKYKSSKKSSKSKHRHRSSSSDSSEYEKKSKSRNRRDSSSDDGRSRRRNKR